MFDDDMALLREYAEKRCERSFATLVERHAGLVFSAAQRQVGNGHAAEEITQAVFIVLARKAAALRTGTILSGWLYQTARLTARTYLRGEVRRQLREQEAHLQSTLNEPDPAVVWEQIAPMLDEAMASLGETDRNAVVLRFFENKSVREIASALKVSDDAAQKRLTRAVDKLRSFFAKRDCVVAGAALAGSISANALHAAPAEVVSQATMAAMNGGATASASTSALSEGVLKGMAREVAKSALSVTAGAIVLVGVAGASWFSFFSEKDVVAFDSFGPNKSYDSGAWGINHGEWFVPKISGRLHRVEVAVVPGFNDLVQRNPRAAQWIVPPLPVKVSIAEDDNGLPGRVLETFFAEAGESEGHRNQMPAPMKSHQKPTLRAGVKYWLTVEDSGERARNQDSWSWHQNRQSKPQPAAREVSPGVWKSAGSSWGGAFRVTVTPTDPK